MSKHSPPVAFVLSLCFLCFALGATLASFELFPYSLVHKAYLGGKAALDLTLRRGDRRFTMAWHKQRDSDRGLVRYVPENAWPGYTLYTSAHAQAAYLLSMDGSVVHEWHVPYNSMWEPCEALPRRPNQDYVYWRKAHLFPNGDILVICVEAGATPWGAGLFRIDKHSNVVWQYPARVHHDFCFTPDGRIITLIHDIRRRPIPGVPNVKVPFVEDFVSVLSPGGRELERMSLYSAMCRSPFKPLVLYAPSNEKGDYLHANAVEYLDRDMAARFPFAREGQVLVSFRDIHFVGLLDLQSKLFTWGTTGPWLRQHDPRFLNNGTILLFDNLGRMGSAGGRSRSIEVDPVSHEITWCYKGDHENTFFSEVRSAQQRLPNGNTLITESDAGRILEVTPDREIVWEYRNPAVAEADKELIAAACFGTRVDSASLDLAFTSLLKKE